ncbi:hypothetical protein CEXT_172161 [Caerostris extrusa]|uniref:Uncharacterized protein n=1 Tax=Caerostris extrusa TaxID=172846 RepID=A0AAV4XUW8_CAEEX|nr:hypothetical protein CEXT_172161 [Caerostris extrusa]
MYHPHKVLPTGTCRRLASSSNEIPNFQNPAPKLAGRQLNIKRGPHLNDRGLQSCSFACKADGLLSGLAHLHARQTDISLGQYFNEDCSVFENKLSEPTSSSRTERKGGNPSSVPPFRFIPPIVKGCTVVGRRMIPESRLGLMEDHCIKHHGISGRKKPSKGFDS